MTERYTLDKTDMRPNLLARTLLVATLLVAASGCRSTGVLDPVVGTFLATTFVITPTGQGPINVLAQGGTLGINVADNFVTTGTLIIPPALNAGTTLTVSLAGTAVRTDNTVRFMLEANTFVRNLTFTLDVNTLTANQTVADTTYNLVLTRQ